MQMLVSSIDYNDYVGRIGIGRVERGTVRVNQEVAICDYHDPSHSAKGKIVALYEFDGLGKNPIQEAGAGEIVAFSGMRTSPSAARSARRSRWSRCPS